MSTNENVIMNTNENVMMNTNELKHLPISPYFGTELWENGTAIPLIDTDGKKIQEISRYFYNNDTNQIISYGIINNTIQYYDTATGEHIIPTLPPYYEISLKDYLEKIKPITQIKVTDKSPEQFLKSIEDFLWPLVEADMNYKQYVFIDKLKDTFSKQLDFNTITTTLNNEQIKTLVLPQDTVSTTPITTIENEIKNNPKLLDLYIVFNFLRSYIDLYHDILNNGISLCENIREHFEETFVKSSNTDAKRIYKEYIKMIIENPSTKIFTSTKNINQSRCHSVLETITDEFIKILHKEGIRWIPKTRQEAFVKSISISNITEFNELIEQLKTDGVNSFFVESANSSIGQKFSYNKFPRSNLSIGEWDAGSGYSKGEQKYLVGPTGDIKIENPELKLFNIYDIIISPDNKTLNIKYNNKNIITIIGGPKKLSVNSLLNTVELSPIRGESTGINLGIGKITESYKQNGVISLKTWTDLIQIAATSASKIAVMKDGSQFKQAIIISDGLCEVTARMYGLGHVIKNEKNIATYYCYDNNSRVLSIAILNIRLKLKATIIKYKDILLKNYIDGWFNQRINYLKFVLSNTIDPALYFVSFIYIDIYEKNKNKALMNIDNIANIELKNLPSTLNDYIESITESTTTLANLFQQFDKFQEAIGYVDRLRSRATIDEYLNAYDTVKQEIINTFKDSDALQLRVLVATTIASSFMKGQRPEHLFISLDTIKKLLIKKLLINNYRINISLNLENVQKNISSGNTNNNKDYLIADYLPRINKAYNQLKSTNSDIANTILNICDVELALIELIKLESKEQVNHYNFGKNVIKKKISYYEYVQRISSINNDLLHKPEKSFSFESIIISVGNRIRNYIGKKNTYLGGNIYKNKTYKNKHQKKQIKYKKITIKKNKKSKK